MNAVNLDGGSSSEMVYQGKVLNKLPNVFGERYVVMEKSIKKSSANKTLSNGSRPVSFMMS